MQGQGLPIDRIADHGISLGIYMRDPDGNGVEVYYEMPRAEWPVIITSSPREDRPRPFPRPVGQRRAFMRPQTPSPQPSRLSSRGEVAGSRPKSWFPRKRGDPVSERSRSTPWLPLSRG